MRLLCCAALAAAFSVTSTGLAGTIIYSATEDTDGAGTSVNNGSFELGGGNNAPTGFVAPNEFNGLRTDFGSTDGATAWVSNVQGTLSTATPIPAVVSATDIVTFGLRAGNGNAAPGSLIDVELSLVLDAGLGSETIVPLGALTALLEDFGGPTDFATLTGSQAVGASGTTVGVLIAATNQVGTAQAVVDSLYLEISPVPEPASAALCLLGLAGVAIRRR